MWNSRFWSPDVLMALFSVPYFFTNHAAHRLVIGSTERVEERMITLWSKRLETHYKMHHGGSCPKSLNKPEEKSCCRPALCPRCCSPFLSYEKSFRWGLEINPRVGWNKAIRITKLTQPMLKIKTIAGFPRMGLFYRQTQYQIKTWIPCGLPSLVYV